MVYRSTFSTMLTEMAVKLSGQWPLDVVQGQLITDARLEDDTLSAPVEPNP